MNKTVIDASALLALLNAEPGAELVAEAVPNGIISAVNQSEVVSKLCEAGISESVVHQTLESLGLEIIPFDKGQSYEAGFLRKLTQKYGLSLGDRACLSLAGMLGATALTADKIWTNLPVNVDVKVIR